MSIFSRKKSSTPQVQLRSGTPQPFGLLDSYVPLADGETRLYRSIREAVPVVDAAIMKIIRLTGGFEARCGDKKAERELNEFIRTVNVGRGQQGLQAFVSQYLDSMITCGRAVGEIVTVGNRDIAAVLCGNVVDVQIKEGETPLDFTLCSTGLGGAEPLPYQNLLLFTPFNPEADSPYGVSMLRSMPFLCGILLKIYQPLGITNIRSTTMPALYNFSVSVGESAWGVLKRYCRYASNIQPRFSKDGMLILDKAAGDSALINTDKDVVAVRLHNERYGIISTVQMINRVTGQSYTVNNQKFINSGGKRRHVMTIPRNLGANAARYTGEYQIAESERGKKYVELTMTVQFLFFPGDVVHIFNDALGLDGTYTVASTHCWADGVSAGTVLKLEV